MRRQLHLLLLLLLLLAALLLSALAIGEWNPIKDVRNPHVKEIGEFAVAEFNKDPRHGADLQFQSVIKGETQVVSGTNYRLILAARDPAGVKNYEALVWEKPWEHFKQLKSFSPVKDV
ncbi:cysteine proteinase inhibitor 1-like [Rhodamnia argentea]|uniref:Cysteine proteinase inhibitor 1-like n=1 Tax=Rhodamnia argentea TaxID=178133 RepID=A0A8B8NA16_9MYRT|nr:cysteine proteinase inhibitor 1-like [Rhodamnia argentea]